MSEHHSHINEGDCDNVIKAFQDWRAKGSPISDGVILPTLQKRPSLTRRIFRTITLGFIAVLIVLAVVVLQSGNREVAKIISALQASLARSAAATNEPSATSIGASEPGTQSPAASQGASPVQATQEQYNEISHQIDALVNQLTDVRRVVEQLAANQQKMGQDIAALKANGESINHTLLSALSQRTFGPAAARAKPKEQPTRRVTGQPAHGNPSVGAPLPLR
jgi:hypothetical protein